MVAAFCIIYHLKKTNNCIPSSHSLFQNIPFILTQTTIIASHAIILMYSMHILYNKRIVMAFYIVIPYNIVSFLSLNKFSVRSVQTDIIRRTQLKQSNKLFNSITFSNLFCFGKSIHIYFSLVHVII